MTSGLAKLLSIRTLVAIAIVAPAILHPVAAAYDSPNFDASPFDPEGLSLDDNARDEVVGALAALAINFPDESQVDDDLREKALAIALSIKPLDGAARNAHASLLKGRNPKPVDFFSTLSSISKALWRHGESLAARDAEPEDRKLAPYLMEIALVLSGGPDNDQIWLFGHATNFKPLPWNSLVKLQGSAFESNRHAQNLAREAETLRKLAVIQSGGSKPSPPGISSPGPNGGKGKAKSKGKGKGNGQVAGIQSPRSTIRFAAFVPDIGAVPGEAMLEIRKPNADERSLFGLFLGTDGKDRESFPMRLSYDREGPSISGYETAGNVVKATYPTWPKNLIGEFTFKAAGPNQPGKVDLALPGAILLESAFSGAAVPPDLAIAGSLAEDGSIGLPAPASEFARAAGIGGGAVVKVLLLPSEASSGLTDAVTNGDLTVLVRPQVVAFSSFGEAKSLALDARPEDLTKAIQMFEEIQNLTAQGMSLDEIAKNAAVQDRLRSIVDLWPDHLSAKIMLAYGTQPVDMRLSAQGVVGQIDNVVKPVAKHYTDSVFGGGTVVGDAEKLIDRARTTLRELRTKAHEDARGCLNSSDRAIEAFDKYFSQTNKSSSRAAQLRRELQETINELNAARTQLGATENISL